MMKKSLKTILGVTLLEIMLVLAIAAMVILLSIRYYQSASYSSQANQLLSTFQSITAAAENLSAGTGTYTGTSQAQIAAILPANALTSPWATPITYSPSDSNFTVTVPSTPAGVCQILAAKLATDAHTQASSTASDCSGTMTFSYNYVLSP